MKAGEKKEISISLPKDFHKEQLAGKTIIASFTIESVSKRILPKLDETFVERITGKQQTVDAFKEEIEFYLKEKRKQEQYKDLQKQLHDQWETLAQFDAPESEITAEADYLKDNLKLQVLSSGTPWQKYLETEKTDEESVIK